MEPREMKLLESMKGWEEHEEEGLKQNQEGKETHGMLEMVLGHVESQTGW